MRNPFDSSLPSVAGLCVFVAIGAISTPAAVITWIGGAGTSWHTPGNWDLGRVPAAGDDVYIPAGPAQIQFSTGQTSVRSLVCEGILQINDGSGVTRLSLDEASVVGGELRVSRDAEFGGAGSVTILGHLQWEGVLLGTGTLTLAAGATCEIYGGPRMERRFINHGVVTLRAVTFPIANVNWTNEADGEVRVTFTGSITVAAGAPRIINYGTITHDWGGSSVHNTYPFVENHGLIHMVEGFAQARGGFLHDGLIHIDPLATFAVNGDGSLLPGGSVTGGGQIELSLGTHHVNCQIDPALTVDVAAGDGQTFFERDYAFSTLHFGGTAKIVDGPGRLTCGTITWAGGIVRNAGGLSADTVRLQATDRTPTLGTALTVTQLFDVTDGAFRPMNLNNGSLTVAAGATLVTHNSYGFVNQAGSNLVRNLGSFQLEENCSIGVRFENAGQVTLSTATLTLSGGGVNSGSIEIPAPSSLSYAGDYDHTDVIPTGNGQLNFTGGVHSIPAGFPLERTARIDAAATVTVDFDWTIAQPLTLSGILGGLGSKTLGSTFEWAASGKLVGPGLFTVPAGAVVDSFVTGTRTLQNTTLRNEGTLILPGSALQFRAASLINAPGGVIQMGGGCTLANTEGVTQLVNQGRIGTGSTGSGTRTIAVPFDNFGTIEAGVGELSITGLFSSLQNGVLTGGPYLVTQRLMLPGPVQQIAAAQVYLLGSGAFVGSPSAPNANFAQLAAIANDGTLQLRNGAGLVRSVPLPLESAGLLDIGPNCLVRVEGTYTQAAGRTVVDGVLDARNSAVFAIAGTLNGGGTIQPGLLCPAELSPGSMIGTLSIQGSAQLTPSSALHIEIAGAAPSEHDQLLVAGAVQLLGELRVELLNGYLPPAGTSFEIIRGTVLGQFSQVSLPAPTPGACWVIAYDPERVLLKLVSTAGDANSDGAIDLTDLAILLANFGRSGDVSHEDGDADGDNDVDLADLSILLSSFGVSC